MTLFRVEQDFHRAEGRRGRLGRVGVGMRGAMWNRKKSMAEIGKGGGLL